MRSVTKDNITEVFTSYFGEGTDPRVKEVLSSLAQHMHDFAREVNLTHDEWRMGIDFLTRAGEITTPERQEFVLLSDVMGLSSLVDMLHSTPEATSSSVLGPFHVSNPPPLAIGGDMKRDFEGEVVLVEGTVRDTEGNPISGATIDIWQTAPNGLYSSQDEDQDIHSFHGLMTADENGRYAFTTVRPVEYTVPSDGPVGDILNAAGRHPWRPSHLHYIVSADGHRSLVTEVFPDDDPYLDQDTVFGVRDDLVMTYVKQPAGSFPEGFALSGSVDDAYSRVDFDLVLAKA
ncbi:dioxygenase [Shimia haliotis]|uniref:Hydroxyquinol 1,2-dioxygenase n=1 Tax=Shimia haliotis TaxID=1280847 RepID=A0A1I4GFA8_9RHOB|nr:dioxygenase [Shimia haliotis]SFL28752.1 hydroxyquinol 1,2-dioxygenase [Shimia haliotis]